MLEMFCEERWRYSNSHVNRKDYYYCLVLFFFLFPFISAGRFELEMLEQQVITFRVGNTVRKLNIHWVIMFSLWQSSKMYVLFSQEAAIAVGVIFA